MALLAVLLAVGAAPLVGDVITQTNAEGKKLVIQRDCIVVKEDSSVVVYKHFDLAEHRVVKVSLDQGSLPYDVDRGTKDQRQQIVSLWKQFGYTVTVTDESGKTTQVFDAYLDFYPPGGHGSLLDSVPARTAFPILLDNGGADSIDFSEIARIDFDGGRVKLTKQDGKVETGKFLMPTNLPAEARLLGVTAQYDPGSTDVFDYSVPLGRLKQVQFAP